MVLCDHFRDLTKQGAIKPDELKVFLLNIPYKYFRAFAYFKAIVRQRTYSAHDTTLLANTISQIATVCYLDTYKAFQRRVKSLDKEKALHSHVRAVNCWQILKNAVAKPMQLRGSDILRDKEEEYCLFMIENEEFEEINYGNLG